MPLLHLHGTPRLARDSAAELALSAREAALLAWLHAAGPTPRARIAGLLWPGGSEAQARANLRQTLARLKRAAGDVVAEEAGALHLAVPVADAAGQPLLGPLAFDDAPEFAAWLEGQRDDALRRHQRERLAAAQAALDGGDLDGVLAEVDAVLATHRESEEAWRLRMEAFQRRGDRASALQAWDECRHAIRSAFGVAPSAETQALGQRILASEMAPTPAAGGLPAALRRPPQLVGRADTLAALLRSLALGHGAVVLGPGGIGKSRLLAEAAQRHAPALLTGARPGDALRPGALLARLVGAGLRRFEPELDPGTRADLARLQAPAPGQPAPADLKSALEHRRVLAAVTRALQACLAMGMRLIVVDDLHYADDASLQALQLIVGHWLAQAADAAAPPLLGARGEELSAAGMALVDMLGRSGRAARLDLQPLALPQVQALLDALPLPGAELPPALAGALHAQLGGNPAFLLESLKSLWLEGLADWSAGQPVPVPPPLLEAVRRRLQRLSPEALQLAQLAAVAQGDFSLTLASEVCGRNLLALAPLLTELQQAQVFDGQAFGHDLVAESVRGALPGALATALHALVAEHLVARQGAPGSIAHHLLAAGQRHAAARWQLQAAHVARAGWLMADAAAAYEAAARALDRPAERAEAGATWREAARCWLWANRQAEAKVALDAAAPLLASAAEQALLHSLQASWHFNQRQLGEAVAIGQALVGELRACAEQVSPAELVYGVRALGSLVPHGVDVASTLALADQVQRRIAPEDDHSLLLLRSVRGGLLHWALRPQEAAADLATAWQQTSNGADPGQRVLVANQLMRVQHALGDLPAAMQVAQALLRDGGELQLGLRFQSDVQHVLAMMEVASGQAAAGMARFDRLMAALQAAGEPVPDAFYAALALASMAVGRNDEAAAWLQRHPAPGQQGFMLPDIAWTLTRVKLAYRLGEDAAPWLARVPALDALPPALQLQCEAALATLRPTPLATLQALAERLCGLGLRGLQRSVEIAAARTALAAQQHAAAIAHARGALALAAQVDGWVDEPATVWLTAADVLAACGQHDEAVAAATAGAAWVRAGVAQWDDAAARHAWCAGNPVHRALLTRHSS
jgi:DNA-binding SARP family transcriptional activator